MRQYQEVPIDPFSEFDPYGGEPAPGILPGHLLVATPQLEDPNFARRVILVLDHGVQGALGVVIDRPGGVAVDQLLPRWHALATAPAELFTGGPEDGPDRPAGWRLLVDDDRPIGTVDLNADPARYAGSIVGTRLFSGYAGWETGQLEDEIAEGSWYVVRAEARDPISADPEGLWRRVLRRQGGALALVSGYPADPAHN